MNSRMVITTHKLCSDCIDCLEQYHAELTCDLGYGPLMRAEGRGPTWLWTFVNLGQNLSQPRKNPLPLEALALAKLLSMEPFPK